MEKIIQLMPLAEIGYGSARIANDSVEIEVGGINGSLKAWLIGGEAREIGNIVEGKIYRRISTKGHIGILVTQGGRQMLIGKFSDDCANAIDEEKVPFNVSGFNWKKITEKSYKEINSTLRYIMSNKSVYENYRKHRHYWIGESGDMGALALRYEDDEDPLHFLDKKIRKNGYIIVCIDKKTNRLYLPEEER